MKTSAEIRANILFALAHPNRIRILEYLGKGVHCNCELASELDLEQSNLSRHLKILVDTGILRSWKDGLRVNVEVVDDRIFRILDIISALAKQDAAKKAEILQGIS